MSSAQSLREAGPEQQSAAARRAALRVIQNNHMEPTSSLMWRTCLDMDMEIPPELSWQFEYDNQEPLDFSRNTVWGDWAIQGASAVEDAPAPLLTKSEVIELKKQLEDPVNRNGITYRLVLNELHENGSRKMYDFDREAELEQWLGEVVELPESKWKVERPDAPGYTAMQIHQIMFEWELNNG